MQSSSSTSVLLPSQRQSSSSKNWESAFGNLSSSYGFNGAAPSLPQKSSQATKVSNVPSSTTSTPQYTQSPVSHSTAPKDYQNSFGQLSATYGFGGGYYAPSFPAQTSSTSKATHQSPVAQVPTGYEAAYGNLASSYGFGGSYASKK